MAPATLHCIFSVNEILQPLTFIHSLFWTTFHFTQSHLCSRPAAKRRAGACCSSSERWLVDWLVHPTFAVMLYSFQVGWVRILLVWGKKLSRKIPKCQKSVLVVSPWRQLLFYVFSFVSVAVWHLFHWKTLTLCRVRAHVIHLSVFKSNPLHLCCF